MKENGWVCETYDEFRQHYPVPRIWKAGYVDYTGHTVTFQEQEKYMQDLWNNMRDAIVSRDGVFYPAVDIRNRCIAQIASLCQLVLRPTSLVQHLLELLMDVHSITTFQSTSILSLN